MTAARFPVVLGGFSIRCGSGPCHYYTRSSPRLSRFVSNWDLTVSGPKREDDAAEKLGKQAISGRLSAGKEPGRSMCSLANVEGEVEKFFRGRSNLHEWLRKCDSSLLLDRYLNHSN